MNDRQPEAPLQESKTVAVVTHGAETEWVGEDGVKRRVSVFRTTKNTYGLRIETHWDGEDKPPLVSALNMRPEAWRAVTEAVSVFAAHMGDFAIKEQSNG